MAKTPGAKRIETIHRLLEADYDAAYGVSVNPKLRIEAYTGRGNNCRNLIIEYRWHGDNVSINIYHEGDVPVEFDKLAEWLKG